MQQQNPVVPEAIQELTRQYEDTVEGNLQFLVDQSLYFKKMVTEAKTQVSKSYFQKKLVKNNQKFYKLLVRTPNAFNPFMNLSKERANVDDLIEPQPEVETDTPETE
jgi:hypothetical protein